MVFLNMHRLIFNTTAALIMLVVGAAVAVNKKPVACMAGSLVAPPVPAPTTTRKFDEYGNLRWSDEKARLDNLAIELRNTPDATGYIFCYGGRVGRVGEAKRRCRQAVNYLIGRRGHDFDPLRVVTVDGGYKANLTVELWIIPSDTTPPQASPTVDPSEVTFIRSKPKRKTRPR